MIPRPSIDITAHGSPTSLQIHSNKQSCSSLFIASSHVYTVASGGGKAYPLNPKPNTSRIECCGYPRAHKRPTQVPLRSSWLSKTEQKREGIVRLSQATKHCKSIKEKERQLPTFCPSRVSIRIHLTRPASSRAMGSNFCFHSVICFLYSPKRSASPPVDLTSSVGARV